MRAAPALGLRRAHEGDHAPRLGGEGVELEFTYARTVLVRTLISEQRRHWWSREVSTEDAALEDLMGTAQPAWQGLRLPACIAFNPFTGVSYRRSSPERIRRFAEILQRAGITVTTRKTRGDDIDAACGQLAGQVVNRMKRKPVHVHPREARS